MASIVKSTTEPGTDPIAAIDLGSNSIKMTVARPGSTSGEFDEFLWRSETVRLGQGVDSSGELAADRVAAARDTLARFANEARGAGARRIIGVATEATRIAANGADFIQGISHDFGIEMQTISGDREAMLTFMGLHGIVDLAGKVVVADIGGGSTEIIIATDGSINWSRSFALGSGRLTDRFIATDPPERESLAACRAEARTVIKDAPLTESGGGRLIVVGGTGEYMNKLAPENSPRSPAELDRLLNRLSVLSVSGLVAMIEVPEARARVLPAGVAIAAAVSDEMHPSHFESAQSGIRRGLLLAAFAGEL